MLCLFLTWAPFPFTATVEHEKESVPLSSNPDILSASQLEDCPRDSGCYISSENSDNGKEDLESENLSDMVQKIAITESSDWTHTLMSTPAAEFHLNFLYATGSNGRFPNVPQSAKCFSLYNCSCKFIFLTYQWVWIKCIFIKYYVLKFTCLY